MHTVMMMLSARTENNMESGHGIKGVTSLVPMNDLDKPLERGLPWI